MVVVNQIRHRVQAQHDHTSSITHKGGLFLSKRVEEEKKKKKVWREEPWGTTFSLEKRTILWEPYEVSTHSWMDRAQSPRGLTVHWSHSKRSRGHQWNRHIGKMTCAVPWHMMPSQLENLPKNNWPTKILPNTQELLGRGEVGLERILIFLYCWFTLIFP